MKLKPGTLILLLTAALLGGFVYFYEIQGAPRREEARSQGQRLFAFEEDQIQAVTITTDEQVLAFTQNPSYQASTDKNAQSATNSRWLLQVLLASQQQAATPTPQPSPTSSPTPSPPTEEAEEPAAEPPDSPQPSASPQPAAKPPAKNTPAAIPASEPSLAYLLNLLATGKSDRTLTATAEQKAEYGLDKPTAIVDVTLNNQEKHQLVLGKPDFNRSFLYALVDPPAEATGNLTVYLVSPDLENAVQRPLEEWKAQEQPKAQPTASPQADPSPSPSAAESPPPEETTEETTSEEATP